MLSAVSCITHNVATAQLPALSADSRRACGVQSLRLAGSHEQACVTHSQAFLASARRCGSAKRSSSLRKAAPRDSNGADTSGEFNLTEYVEAKVERVERTDKDSSMLLLKMLDGRGNILPVFVGDNESTALLQEMQRQPSTRPMTHDLMKNSLEMLGYRVSKVRITCLVANTYFARIHFSQGRKSQEGVCHEIDVDARPSDAINMAVRFDAPVYVHKQVANRMACQPEKFRPPTTQTTSEITRSCKDLLMHFPDPTVVDKLHLQLAIVEERYADALK
ncbi:TPA: hypothetical protein ACH3X3_000903 [Trebouxia sp. C0006]